MPTKAKRPKPQPPKKKAARVKVVGGKRKQKVAAKKPRETQAANRAAVHLPVRITEELKRAAAGVAPASLHPDDLAAADIVAVSLDYDGIEVAGGVVKAATILAKHFAQRHWQLVDATISLEADSKRGHVKLPWELWLPECFNTLIDDIAKTELELLEIDVWLVEAARLFCATFPTENLIRVDLVPRGEEGKSAECLQCEKVAPALLKSLRDFAGALVKAVVTGPHHVVTITGKEFSELEIKSDEQVVVFGKKNAALRALLALGLLRNRVDFTVEEFAKLYFGKPSDDPGKTFNNAMNELRRFCPQVTYDKNRAQRRISGLVFKSVPAEAVIHEIIQLLYRE